METKKFYFTFGVGDPIHAHKYVVIESDNYEKARSKMFKLFGSNWAFDYPEDKWFYRKGTPEWNDLVTMGFISPDEPAEILSQADVWNLTELSLCTDQ